MTRHLLAAICLTVPLAGCVADQPARTSLPVPRAASELSPRTATNRCPQGPLVVAINGQTAQVTGPGDIDVTLQAAPPGQQIRFTDRLNALVVEGREAMFMANRKAPLTCQL